jgi:Arc/MetJ-type ribon-helix-helix transcriptional regulator
MPISAGEAETGNLAHLAPVLILAYLEDKQTEVSMSQTTTMTVRISGALSEFVASNVGENGSYENISEYVRDLIRRDKERVEREAFDRLKGELTRAFAAPEESYRPLTVTEVIARNRG